MNSHPIKNPDRTKDAIKEFRARIEALAREGNTSKQIAAALGRSEKGLKSTLRRWGITVPADRVVGNSHRHDPARILSSIVMDAEHLTADIALIDFAALPPDHLKPWIKSLRTSYRHIRKLIARLRKEQYERNETLREPSHPVALESTPRADQSNANPSGACDATTIEKEFLRVALAQHGFE